MSQFNSGDFVTDLNGISLYICTGSRIALIKGARCDSFVHPMLNLIDTIPSDRLASLSEVADIMNSIPFPQWVIDIKHSIAPTTTKTSPAILAAAVQLPFPLPETPIIPKVELSMSLKSFQSKCIHDWIEYRGFSREYKYCKHCDKKE